MLFRLLIIGLAAVGLAAIVVGVKKRRIINYLSGRTPEEARQIVVEKVSPRVGQEKAEKIADRVVARLDANGLLAEAAEAA